MLANRHDEEARWNSNSSSRVLLGLQPCSWNEKRRWLLQDPACSDKVGRWEAYLRRVAPGKKTECWTQTVPDRLGAGVGLPDVLRTVLRAVNASARLEIRFAWLAHLAGLLDVAPRPSLTSNADCSSVKEIYWPGWSDGAAIGEVVGLGCAFRLLTCPGSNSDIMHRLQLLQTTVVGGNASPGTVMGGNSSPGFGQPRLPFLAVHARFAGRTYKSKWEIAKLDHMDRACASAEAAKQFRRAEDRSLPLHKRVAPFDDYVLAAGETGVHARRWLPVHSPVAA